LNIVTNNEDYLCEGITNVGLIKVTLNRKPYTNKYIIRYKGIRSQESKVFRGFPAADKFYQKAIAAIKENPFADINKLTND